LRSLLDAAHADGIALWPETQPYTTGATPPRLTSCYRDVDMQRWWRDYYCGQGSCGMAAVPGTSVHGWGRAVDFEEAGQELAFHMDGYQWLVGHAPAFGFVQPGWAGPSGTAPEPWHWEAA
jgi:LAS superfamily LD-carboxypeptidase LdcB